MMSSVDIFYEDSYSNEELIIQRLRRSIRDISNPLELNNQLFVSYFRLSKEAFSYLLENITPSITSMCSAAIPPILKLACVLRFFADGSYQKGIGNDFEIGFAQATVSVVLREILNIFESVICPEWIQIQMTADEKQAARTNFYSKASLPGVIGCVDGTHVGIVAPSHFKHQYLNRKGFYSLNVMVVRMTSSNT
ncbi:PREDICTED: putative nuclease HARBI1 [Rhagoletis zephyria]|uniref:putative nuclease HARBI1 n=1 Tax=Rhagoletis zephyria TaxID=28612 RepID=UPI000811927F|nr:PREDICTED: putative nuclease HARBI1 [Rhagoletis zephyria]